VGVRWKRDTERLCFGFADQLTEVAISGQAVPRLRR